MTDDQLRAVVQSKLMRGLKYACAGCKFVQAVFINMKVSVYILFAVLCI
jgi:hypothetical protein